MRQEASELLAALQRTNERGPYILVGHSIGGLVIRVFAEPYPDNTADRDQRPIAKWMRGCLR
jgi:pimeloyl-ACP methyl ester carboxylesterase